MAAWHHPLLLYKSKLLPIRGTKGHNILQVAESAQSIMILHGRASNEKEARFT
jgi:hypothetical protein